MAAQPGEITQVLQRWSQGDQAAGDELMKQVYAQLRRIAQARLAVERPDHTLQPTALVHEAWLKLAASEAMDWDDRVHFMAVSARAMRQIIIDSGRRRQASKRQAPESWTLRLQAAGYENSNVDLFALEQALERLEALDARQARVVELKYFGGLTTAEIALIMKLSTATINRCWRAARAWLYLELIERARPEPRA